MADIVGLWVAWQEHPLSYSKSMYTLVVWDNFLWVYIHHMTWTRGDVLQNTIRYNIYTVYLDASQKPDKNSSPLPITELSVVSSHAWIILIAAPAKIDLLQ